MKAYEIMIEDVFKVNGNDTVRSIIEIFINNRISGLPVVNDRNEIIGYVSDGDILRYIGKHEDRIINVFAYMAYVQGDNEEFEDRIQTLLNMNVLEIAKRKVIKVSWDEEIENIAAILGEKRIKKLPVERNGLLIGIISRGDVIRHSFKSLM
ncbi:CBS domain-containing protein [Gottfriedia sp. S16(2024)]|uniref:CBS domain-containing protein n=1 Tax=Gottfriedia sp. S16(2024) TaxID=3162883 RepID=UPI003D22FE48